MCIAFYAPFICLSEPTYLTFTYLVYPRNSTTTATAACAHTIFQFNHFSYQVELQYYSFFLTFCFVFLVCLSFIFIHFNLKSRIDFIHHSLFLENFGWCLPCICTYVLTYKRIESRRIPVSELNGEKKIKLIFIIIKK